MSSERESYRHDGTGQRPVTRSRRAEPSVLAAIALGGALGAPARYGVAQLIHVAPNSSRGRRSGRTSRAASPSASS